MNKAKKMLDALMGPSRDVSSKNKSNDEFKEPNCCKHYLVNCCPNAMLGKKMEAIRQDPATFCICPGVQFDRPSVLNPEGCTKLHSLGLRTQLNDHPQEKKYRREYEDDLRKYLVSIVSEAEQKVLHEKKKREELGRQPDNEKMCDICGMRYKLKKKEFGIEVGDHHPDSDVHKVYVKLRAKLEELTEKAKEWQAEDDKTKGEDSKEKEKEKEGKSSETRDESRSAKDRDGGSRDRSRSKKERGGGSRERSRSKRDRSRSKKDRGGRENADRDRESGEGRKESRRQSDRPRSRSRDRGRGRDRARSNSRDIDKNRDRGRSDRHGGYDRDRDRHRDRRG